MGTPERQPCAPEETLDSHTTPSGVENTATTLPTPDANSAQAPFVAPLHCDSAPAASAMFSACVAASHSWQWQHSALLAKWQLRLFERVFDRQDQFDTKWHHNLTSVDQKRSSCFTMSRHSRRTRFPCRQPRPLSRTTRFPGDLRRRGGYRHLRNVYVRTDDASSFVPAPSRFSFIPFVSYILGALRLHRAPAGTASVACAVGSQREQSGEPGCSSALETTPVSASPSPLQPSGAARASEQPADTPTSVASNLATGGLRTDAGIGPQEPQTEDIAGVTTGLSASPNENANEPAAEPPPPPPAPENAMQRSSLMVYIKIFALLFLLNAPYYTILLVLVVALGHMTGFLEPVLTRFRSWCETTGLTQRRPLADILQDLHTRRVEQLQQRNAVLHAAQVFRDLQQQSGASVDTDSLSFAPLGADTPPSSHPPETPPPTVTPFSSVPLSRPNVFQSHAADVTVAASGPPCPSAPSSSFAGLRRYAVAFARWFYQLFVVFFCSLNPQWRPITAFVVAPHEPPPPPPSATAVATAVVFSSSGTNSAHPPSSALSPLVIPPESLPQPDHIPQHSSSVLPPVIPPEPSSQPNDNREQPALREDTCQRVRENPTYARSELASSSPVPTLAQLPTSVTRRAPPVPHTSKDEKNTRNVTDLDPTEATRVSSSTTRREILDSPSRHISPELKKDR